MIPKFRARYGSEMYDGPVIHNGDFYLDWRNFIDGDTYDGAVLMQSTGLKDKNGKEIFEGDIVRGGSIDFEVRYGIHSFRNFSGVGFYLIREIDDIYIVEKFFSDITYEVIGNIYENPELVEE